MRHVTIIREPVGRVISAWHYRCHNPNFDCYHVRSEFRTFRQYTLSRDGKGTALSEWVNITFDQYLRIPEYHNVQTRVFAANLAPYMLSENEMKNKKLLQESDFDRAISVLSRFAVVLVLESYSISLLMLSLNIGVDLDRDDFTHQRGDHSPIYSTAKDILSRDPYGTMILEANAWDLSLHSWASRRLCLDIRSKGLEAHPVVLKDTHICRSDLNQ